MAKSVGTTAFVIEQLTCCIWAAAQEAGGTGGGSTVGRRHHTDTWMGHWAFHVTVGVSGWSLSKAGAVRVRVAPSRASLFSWS